MKKFLNSSVIDILCCPYCRNELVLTKIKKLDYLYCKKDTKKFSIKKIEYSDSNNKESHNVIFFLDPKKNSAVITTNKFISDKSIKLPTSKIYFYKLLGKKLDQHFGNIVVDIGGGTNIARLYTKTNLIALDHKIQKVYSPVDIIADSTLLPFKNNSVDCCTSNFVMEFVDTQKYIKENYRILKIGGTAYISFFTKYSYLGYFISVGTYFNYLKKVKKNFSIFIRNPIRHILFELKRGNRKETFISEMRRWKLKKFEKNFLDSGFKIKKREFVGNIFSLDLIYNPISKLLPNYGKRGMSVIYTLVK